MYKCLNDLLGGVLGDGLGTFRDSVLGKLSRKHKADSGLDLSGRKSRLLVVAAKFAGFASDALEDVVDEGVHDGHGSLGDTGVRVYLLQHFVDVAGVGFDSGLPALGAFSGFLTALTLTSFTSFSWHIS